MDKTEINNLLQAAGLARLTALMRQAEQKARNYKPKRNKETKKDFLTRVRLLHEFEKQHSHSLQCRGITAKGRDAFALLYGYQRERYEKILDDEKHAFLIRKGYKLVDYDERHENPMIGWINSKAGKGYLYPNRRKVKKWKN